MSDVAAVGTSFTREDMTTAFQKAVESNNSQRKEYWNNQLNAYDLKNPAPEPVMAPMADFRTGGGIPTAPENLGRPIPMDGPILNELKGGVPQVGQQGIGGQVGTLTEGTVPAVGQAVVNNLDVPVGIAGAAAAGALGGAIFGPPGMIVGGIAGGMVGTFAGGTLSQYFGDPDESALYLALEAGVIDTTVYLAASKFKKVGAALGLGKEGMAKIFPEWFKKNIDEMEPVGAGTPKSKVQSQDLLTDPAKQGDVEGGLTAYQAGVTSGIRSFSEGVGQIGSWSKGMYDKRDAINANTIQENLKNLQYQAIDEVEVDSSYIGQAYEGILAEGRKAATYNYGVGLDTIKNHIGNEKVNPAGFVQIMDKFSAGKQELVGTALTPEAAGVIKKFTTLFESSPSMDVKSLLLFKKNLSQDINAFLDPVHASTTRTAASQQLSELNGLLDRRIRAVLTRVDPESANNFNKLNLAFGTAQTAMLPKITNKFLRTANQESYDKVGSMMVKADANEIEALYNSMNASFLEVSLKDATESALVGSSYQPVGRTLIYKNQAEAKQALQQGWMKETFGDLQGTFDGSASKFTNLAKRLEGGDYSKRVKAVFGSDFGKFKVIVNAISDMSQQKLGAGGGLVIKGKELGAGQALAGAALSVGTGVVGGPIGAMATAALWFGAPKLISFMASNPKAITRLLAGKGESSKFMKAGNVRAADAALTKTLTEIIDMMSPEEKESMAETMGSK